LPQVSRFNLEPVLECPPSSQGMTGRRYIAPEKSWISGGKQGMSRAQFTLTVI
jgi:hypothetical protein